MRKDYYFSQGRLIVTFILQIKKLTSCEFTQSGFNSDIIIFYFTVIYSLTLKCTYHRIKVLTMRKKEESEEE